MSNDKLWIITVTIGFSLLLTLSYFVLVPMASEQGMLVRTDAGLNNAIEKFEQLKEQKQGSDESDLNT
ncbi:MAG TPA: hypothetical protein VGA92_02830 [Candidatus Nitrosotenuis sp.]